MLPIITAGLIASCSESRDEPSDDGAGGATTATSGTTTSSSAGGGGDAPSVPTPHPVTVVEAGWSAAVSEHVVVHADPLAVNPSGFAGATVVDRRPQDGAFSAGDGAWIIEGFDLDDHFGFDVATDGAAVAIAATGYHDGIVRVYDRLSDGTVDGGPWIELGLGSGAFGSALAIDDDLLVIGSPGAFAPYGMLPDAEDPIDGVVYLLKRVGSTWQRDPERWEAIYLSPDETIEEERFGTAVAKSGETLAVGAPGIGGVYTFDVTASEVAFTEKLTPASGAVSFGSAIDLDGDTLVVGDPGAGRAHVFERHGGTWAFVAEMNGPAAMERDRLSRDLGLGVSVAASGDLIAVASPLEGVARLLVKGVDGWVEIEPAACGEPVVETSGHPEDAVCGYSVALSERTLFVGRATPNGDGEWLGDLSVFDVR